MRLIFLSGLSGSGKSIALHVLEDLDFYCIDNIPAALLQSFIAHTVRAGSSVYQRTAIGIDALADKLERRVRKHKEKLTDHHAEQAQKIARL